VWAALVDAKSKAMWYGAHERNQNSIRCLKHLGIEVERVVFAPVASATAIVSPIDKKRGVVIDTGEGTNDHAVYSGGALVQRDCLSAGGGRIEHLALEIFDLFPVPRFRMRGIEADTSSRRERSATSARIETKAKNLIGPQNSPDAKG
jgi:hypothetical protein